MFEDQTFDVIMERMLEQVDSSLDKREGSIIYDALAPAAAEIRTLYLSLDALLDEFNISTATEGYLKQYGEDFSIEPEEATCAVIIGEFSPSGADIGNKTFSLDGINYIAADQPEQLSFDVGEDEESSGSVRYSLTAQTAGSAGNISTGTLIPVDNIEGLQTATVVGLSIAGEDEEDTESFRERLLDRVKNSAFGGNVAYYKQVVSEIDGVGAVRVLPCTSVDDDDNRIESAGHVTVEVLDNKYTSPSDELIETIKDVLIGDGANGGGYGLAPIGHHVEVVSPKIAEVTVQIGAVFGDGTTGGNYSDDAREEITESLTDALSECFSAIREEWESSATDFRATVSALDVVYAIMSTGNISSIYNLKLGVDGNWYSLSLDFGSGKTFDRYVLPILSGVEVDFGGAAG